VHFSDKDSKLTRPRRRVLPGGNNASPTADAKSPVPAPHLRLRFNSEEEGDANLPIPRPLRRAVLASRSLPLIALMMRLFRRTRMRLYHHVFTAITVAGCAVVFFLIPQVQRIWASQTPPPQNSAWLINWLASALFLTLDLVFYVLSLVIVPRADLPLDVSWQRMRAAEHGSFIRVFARLTDTALMVMNVLVCWLVFARDCILRSHTVLTVLVGVGMAAFGAVAISYGPADDSSRSYLLAGALCHNVAVWSMLAGAWLVFVPLFIGSRKLNIHSGRQRDLVFIVLGRLIAWLFIANLIGEILWGVASLSGYSENNIFSYRLYTLWGMLHILALLTLLAATADYLDRNTDFPGRLLVLMVLFFVGVLVRPEKNSDVELIPLPHNQAQVADPTTNLQARPIPFQAAQRSEQWYQMMESRLRSIPADDPVVIVAASGGGSRAAIFSALVMEYLAQTEIPGSWNEKLKRPRRWADNIILMSSVSGGSLATAHFTHRGCRESDWQSETNHTIQAELIQGIVAEINRLGGADNLACNGEDWRQTRAMAMKIRDGLLRDGAKSPYAWLFRKRFIDDMCANFMAPILRGMTAARLYRGDALGKFWNELFDWDESNNLDGYHADEAWTARNSSVPAALFNASDVSKGARLVIGFPPLPHNIFPADDHESEVAHADHPQTSNTAIADSIAPLYNPDGDTRVTLASAEGIQNKDDGLLNTGGDVKGRPQSLSRHAPHELVHLHSSFESRIGLARAVRLSSNFPWGFFASRIEFPEVENHPTHDPVLVLDGAIVDNTGIDTLFDVYHGLQASPRGRRLLSQLTRRRVVFIEIDSGSKPSPAGWVTRTLGVTLEPIQALGNAAYTNADRTKNFYIEQLRREIETGEGPTNGRAEPSEIESQSSSPRSAFFYVKVECNHFSPDSPDQGEVMTAWALSPREKASVMARFVFALWPLEYKLAEIERTRDSAAKAQEIADALRPVEVIIDQLEEQIGIEINRTAMIRDWLVQSDNKNAGSDSAGEIDERQIRESGRTLFRQRYSLRSLRQIVHDLPQRPNVTAEQLTEVHSALDRWQTDLDSCKSLYQTKFPLTLAQSETRATVAEERNDWAGGTEKAFQNKAILPARTVEERQRLRQALKRATEETDNARQNIQELNNRGREWFETSRNAPAHDLPGSGPTDRNAVDGGSLNSEFPKKLPPTHRVTTRNSHSN